jgi:hypothetical protein
MNNTKTELVNLLVKAALHALLSQLLMINFLSVFQRVIPGPSAAHYFVAHCQSFFIINCHRFALINIARDFCEKKSVSFPNSTYTAISTKVSIDTVPLVR